MPTINGMDVKREISDKRPKGEDRLALLSGFARSCLSIIRHGNGESELCLDCQTGFVRDHIASLMLDAFRVTPKDVGGSNSIVYSDGDKLLRGLYIVDPESGEFYDGIPPKFASSAYYACGVFLGCGSMSVPQADYVKSQKSAGYHLEFAFNAESLADAFVELLGTYGISARKAPRSEKCVVYVKDSESVSDCLALIGADRTVIKLNETVAALAVKRDVVKRSNCEVANLDRTAKASAGMIDVIEYIDAKRGLDSIDPKLAVAARAKLNDRDAPLSEIAEKLGISKSGLKHRMDKLTELAHDIAEEEEGQ